MNSVADVLRIDVVRDDALNNSGEVGLHEGLAVVYQCRLAGDQLPKENTNLKWSYE